MLEVNDDDFRFLDQWFGPPGGSQKSFGDLSEMLSIVISPDLFISAVTIQNI